MSLDRKDYTQKPLNGDQAIDFAMSVFDDPLVALRWLNTNNSEFEGSKPIDIIKSDIGEKRVMSSLTRIQENVYN